MAEAVISLVVETLGNLLIEEGKFLHGVKDQADQLHAELKQMQWFLKDADQRQNEADRIGEWISRVRGLAYEAENLIEHYAFKIQSPKERGVAINIKRCICLLDETVALHQVGSDIESLTIKISDLTRSFHNYGIRAIVENEGGSSSRQQHELRRTYSHVVEKDLVGIEGQVEMLAKNLIGENYSLVGIWGMGGLGKTTLARKVYHHPDVRRHFEAFSWICISQQWQTRDLLQGLITKFMPEKRGSIKELRNEELVRELFEFQQNHKCLVVIDDIWSTDAWECIKHAFSIRESGSKVLLTTRNREVATHIDVSDFLYQPRFLSEDESWELLQRKFPVQRHTQGCDDETIQRMEELGKEMIKHCGGLPLAILVLRGILATKKTLVDWENVHKNIKSYLGKENKIGQDHRGLHSILALSYNDLPYRLKPCFLYLSQYLEDVYIEAESLYQIWMAEGMISMDDQIGEETMMDVAERYLGELSKRCMVFVDMNEGPSINRFKYCRLHDLMRDLCLLKAKEENFLKLIDGRHVKGTDQFVDSSFFNSRYPRLAVHLLGNDVKRYVPSAKELTQQLRSFSFSLVGGLLGREEIASTMKLLFAGYKMLRVLSIIGLAFKGLTLEGYSTLEDVSFPREIGNLIHLRYFSLRGSRFLIVPSFISKLNHLQTLDLRCYDTQRISSATRKLGRLKHLYLPYDVHLDCKVRLDGLHNLEILEHFDSRNSDVKVLSILTNLRSLEATVHDKLEDLEEFIKQVNHLRYLRCLFLETKNCDFDSEKGFTLLREMFSCSRLNRLFIRYGRLSKLPEYEPCFLPNLHSLILSGTRMEEDPMRTLEKLPNLRQLSLWDDAFIGNEMICRANGFLQLKSFALFNLTNLNNLWIEEGAMSNLSQLGIWDCRELNNLHMPEEFKARLQVKDNQEGEDFNKVRHVPSIIIHDW